MRSMLKRSFVATCMAIVLSAMPASAAQWIVTTTADAEPGSLRQAIADAASGDTITFDLPNPSTIVLTGGELQVNKALTIQGPGADRLTVKRDAAAPRFRVFSIGGGASVSMAGLTISGGLWSQGSGVAVFGSLTLSDAVVTGNVADGSGKGGGISVGGSLTLVKSTIASNSAVVGAGIWATTTGRVMIERSTISMNSASLGGGIAAEGEWFVTIALRNSTLSNNTATGDPGGGGLYLSGPVSVQFDATTVAGNYGSGLVIAPRFDTGAPIIHYRNSVFSNPGAPNYSGVATTASDGFNISSDATLPLTNPTDHASTNPLLGPLQMNGGSTATHALLAGSLAIDAGSCIDSAGTAITIDQRGTSRPQGVACDIGALEADLALATYENIAALQGSVGQLQTSVASLASQASVNGLTQSLADLGAAVALKSSQSSVDAVSAMASVTQASVTDMASSMANGLSTIDGRIQTLINTIPTEGSIGAVAASVSRVETDVASKASQAGLDALTRLAIERALGDGTRVVSYMLPTSAGGQLEAVRTIVDEAIAGMDFMQINVTRPSAKFVRGDEALSIGDFRAAYDFYVAAYQLLVR